MKTAAKTKKITINPREPLTNKARKGIEAYAWHKANKLHIFIVLVNCVLEAERMRREQLYQWLEDHGYKWNGAFWYSAKEDTNA